MIRLCAFSDEADKMLDGQISALRRNGISLTELRGIDGTNIGKITDIAAKDAKSRLDDGGISVWSLGSPYGKTSLGDGFDEEALFGKLRHLCELANIFECDKLRVFSFFDAYEKKDLVIDLLGRSVEIAAEYGVGLYHENEKEIYGDVPDRVLDLTAVKGLRFVYDPANYLQCGVSSEESLSKTFDLSSYFHIKDVISATDELVPAGEGDGNIPGMLERVKGDTVLTIEPHLTAFGGLSEIDKTGIKNKYHFNNNNESFDAAVSALKNLLTRVGFRFKDGGYTK